jgi:hypothetical protein
MKFCKDCKWYQKEWYCYNPSLGVSLIDATPLNREVRYCRKLKTLCGPTAKWFEEKEKPIPLCVDCKWKHGIDKSWICISSNHKTDVNIITGVQDTLFCAEARIRSELCGKYGKWWEKKVESFPISYIEYTTKAAERLAALPPKQSWLCRLICGRKK